MRVAQNAALPRSLNGPGMGDDFAAENAYAALPSTNICGSGAPAAGPRAAAQTGAVTLPVLGKMQVLVVL